MPTLRTRELASLLAVAAALAVLLGVWLAKPTAGGDTPWLLDGTDVLRGCLSRGDLVACGEHAHPDPFGLTTAIGPWPPLQYVPDLTATYLGATTHPTRVRILVTLGIVALLVGLALTAAALARFGQGRWLWAVVLLVIAGPLVAYENVSWGEPLAVGLLLCFVAACLLQPRPALVGLATLLACLTKETAYPFVIGVGVLALVLARRRTGRPIRPHLLWGAAGVVGGLVVSSLFNVLRFGVPWNENYLRQEFHTPGVARKLEFAAALLVSPNGGILLWWPAAAAVLVAAFVLAWRRRRTLDPRPALVLGVAAAVTLAGLAAWWTPYGWLAWGPRLSLPWILPLVVVALAAYGDALGRLVERLLRSPVGVAATSVFLVALTLPHVGFLWQPGQALQRFFSPTDTHCNGSYLPGSARYYGCVHHQTWFRRPMLLDSLSGLTTTGGALTAAVVAAGIVGCLVLLRDRVELAAARARDRRHARSATPA